MPRRALKRFGAKLLYGYPSYETLFLFLQMIGRAFSCWIQDTDNRVFLALFELPDLTPSQ